jgi:alpha-D-xyloside xylohydrolase
VPYWTLDIGAFFVKSEERWFWRGDYAKGCEDEGYRELYVRWFQLGAFLPMFRSHGTDTPREVWRFGEPGSLTYETLVKFDFLRYRLIPYIYSLAGRVTRDHYTPMRMLAFDFRADPVAHEVADQFMFGPAFLVNPVTTPMYYGPESTPLKGMAKTRSVYLPRGTTWIDFWTGKSERGGQTLESRATLDRIPLYVRAGSIVPMGPKIQFTGENELAPIELRIYPGADGEFTMYEDAGDGYDYEQGASSTYSLRWNQRKKELSIGARQGEFPEMIRQRTFHVVVVGEKRGVGLEESKRPDAKLTYDGLAVSIRL